MKKERHPIDEFFREELNDYQISPTEKSREAFVKDAEGLQKRFPSGWWWFMTLPLAVILLSAGAFIFFRLNHAPVKTGKPISSSIENNQFSKITKQSTEITGKSRPETLKLSETNNPGATAPEDGVRRKQMMKSEILKYSGDETESRPILNEETREADPEIPVSPAIALIGEKTAPVSPGDPAGSMSNGQTADTLLGPLKNEVVPDTSKIPVPIPLKQPVKQTRSSEWRLGAGLYLSPEWMFGTIEEPTFVNNFGFEGMFRFGRYSLRTGAGVSISKGTNQLMVEYNDYLGSYMELDSMSFAWDERHYYLVPTYYLANKDVYDSLMKLEDSKIVKRYTYLQIPIVFGYDFIIKEKMSFGLRAGPIMSILLKEKTLSDPYDPGKKKVISINEITPEQVNVNWQIMVGLNATFRLSRRFGIEVEPFAKYYFNSVHETTSGSGKPWSVGLRAAFFISFEK